MAEAISKYCLDNMICFEEGDTLLDDYHLARLLAVHLIGEVLDEAYIIVNADQESGESWRYSTLLKYIRNFKMDKNISDTDDKVNMTDDYAVEEEENMEDLENNAEDNKEYNKETVDFDNIVVTSSDQKVISELDNDIVKTKNELVLIGQGDAELEQNDKSTRTIISQLFNMSHDFEDLYLQNLVQDELENKEVVNNAMAKILDSYFNTAINSVQYSDDNRNTIDTSNDNVELKHEDYSDYSFLADVFGAEIHKNVAFYIDDQIIVTDDNNVLKEKEQQGVIVEEITDNGTLTEEENNALNLMNANVDAYLSLNRDYEQYSEEEGDQGKYDPKNFSEVDLLSTQVQEPTKPVMPVFNKATKTDDGMLSQSVVTASGTSRKSLVQRCRVHGSRLMACLRGWWRRGTPNSGKVRRTSRGYLSPDYQRRGLSLQNQRGLREQEPRKSTGWKFNTVNETLVNRSHWKDYTFDTKPGQCGEAHITNKKKEI